MPAQAITMAGVVAVARGRILCVDDEPNVLRALQWLLRKDFDAHTSGSPA